MTPSRQARWTAARHFLRRHVALIVLLLVAIPYISAVTVAHSEALSPIDEWVYLDYVDKVPSQGIVHEGEFVGERAREVLACVGVSPFGPVGPDCDGPLPAEEFPSGGLSTASPYTPIYFVLTRYLGDAIAFATGVDDVTGWRLTGVLWLVAALIVFVRLGRQWAVPSSALVVMGMAFIASPFAWWTYSYISTDAPGFLVGALLLYLSVELVRGRHTGWAIVGVGVPAVAFKVTNVLALGLVLLYLGVAAVRREGPALSRESPWRRLIYPVIAIVAAVALEVGWLQLTKLLAVSDLRGDQGTITSPLTVEELLLQVTNFLPGTITSSPIGPWVPGFVYAPLSWLCLAGVLAAVFTIRPGSRHTSLVVTTAVAAALAAPLLAIGLTVMSGTYFQLPPRYGAAILPAFLLLAALSLRNRWAVGTVGAYSVALLATGVWLSIHLATLA